MVIVACRAVRQPAHYLGVITLELFPLSARYFRVGRCGPRRTTPARRSHFSTYPRWDRMAWRADISHSGTVCCCEHRKLLCSA
jgi:hypothetical protein